MDAETPDMYATTANADGSVTMPLYYPIEVRGADSGALIEKYGEIKLRRPKVGDLIAVDRALGGRATAVSAGVMLLGRLTGLASPVIASMDAVDMERCEVVIEGFSVPSPRT